MARDPVEIMNEFTSDRRLNEELTEFYVRALAKACERVSELEAEVARLRDLLDECIDCGPCTGDLLEYRKKIEVP